MFQQFMEPRLPRGAECARIDSSTRSMASSNPSISSEPAGVACTRRLRVSLSCVWRSTSPRRSSPARSRETLGALVRMARAVDRADDVGPGTIPAGAGSRLNDLRFYGRCGRFPSTFSDSGK